LFLFGVHKILNYEDTCDKEFAKEIRHKVINLQWSDKSSCRLFFETWKTSNSCELIVCWMLMIVLWNQKRNTPLHIASLAGKLDVVRVLLSNGASVNARSKASVKTLSTCSIYHIHGFYMRYNNDRLST